MDFVHYDLGYLEEDTTVVVYLDAAANVCVLDSVNFGNYERGYSFEYLGGYVTRSPYCAVIPRDGCWNVAIDLGGYEGRIGSSVDVIPPEKIEVGLTFMGYPAKKYPNKKEASRIYRLLIRWRQQHTRWTWTRPCDHSKFNWENCDVEAAKS